MTGSPEAALLLPALILRSHLFPHRLIYRYRCRCRCRCRCRSLT